MSFFNSDSKTALKLECDHCVKFQLFEDAHDICKETDSCVLHDTAQQPLQSTPALQEASLWALL
jgi:hypothetical protein